MLVMRLSRTSQKRRSLHESRPRRRIRGYGKPLQIPDAIPANMPKNIHDKVAYLEEELFYTRVQLKDMIMDTQKLVMLLLEEKINEHARETS